MKKLLALAFIFSLILVSCNSEPGPPGPPGPTGPGGEDGVNILGQMFEVEVDFNSSNNYEELVVFPDEIEVFDTDVVVTYILTDVVDGLDVWEPLPSSLFIEDDTLLYGFNYTVADVLLFLDGTINLNDLPDSFTQDIIFRIAVLPVDMANDIDLGSFENVMEVIQNKEIMQLN